MPITVGERIRTLRLEHDFMKNMDELNREGKLKVIEYCNDLRQLEKYRKDKRKDA